MSQKTITVGTVDTPVDLDINFGNSQDNFTELYGNITLTATAANNFIVGSVGYLTSAGTVTLADADAEATSKNMLLMANAIVAGGASGVFSRGGDVTVTSHGFTIGAPLFVSATAGEITETVPSTGDTARLIGYALDANTIDFRPDATWVEVG